MSTIFYSPERDDYINDLAVLAKNDIEMANYLFETIKDNIIRYVYKLRIKLPGYDMEDIIQEANIAVFIAIKNYKRDVCDFLPFSYLLIKRKLFSKIRKYQTAGRKSNLYSVSLNEPVYHYSDDVIELKDILADKNNNDENDFIVRTAFKQTFEKVDFSTMERKLLNLIFENEYDYIQLAALLNVNTKSIDNAKARIKKKLRSFFQENKDWEMELR